MVQEQQDRADVARVVAGDTSAFQGIVERWQFRLVNLAWRFCRDAALAEDMAQEVFLRAFRSLPSFRGESAFSTWIIAIAVNTYRSRIRARKELQVSLVDHSASTTAPNPLQELQAREREEAVQRAVLSLPEHYRDSILLFYFEEKDLAETARVLGLSEGTLKSRLHRARALLRERCSSLEKLASEER